MGFDRDREGEPQAQAAGQETTAATAAPRAGAHGATREQVVRWRREFEQRTGISARDGDAVKAWQRAHGVPPTGLVRRATVHALRSSHDKTTVHTVDRDDVMAPTFDDDDADHAKAPEPARNPALQHPDGILTKAEKAMTGQVLPVGTVVHVTDVGEAMGPAAHSSDTLTVRAFSGFDAVAHIPSTSYKPEPALVQKEDEHQSKIGPRDDVYQRYESPLWGKEGPRPEDAETQGAIGDCYFMASMAAVCRANPEAIKALISPHGPGDSYTVRFWVKDPIADTFKRSEPYTVDTWLPTLKGTDQQKAYSHAAMLWAPILEKAWAMHHGEGSYDKIQGGWGADAMEALTGVKSTSHLTLGSDLRGGGLIDKFRQFQSTGKAVVIATRPDPTESHTGWTKDRFKESGGSFSAQLDPSLVFQSVQLFAPNFTGKDDSNNNILKTSGDALLKKGTVDYQKGSVELTFDHKKKPDVKELQVAWSHCGPDFQRYGLVGNHEYRFTGVREPDAINLSNPWGFQHPKPVDQIGIAKVFTEIASNTATRAPDEAGTP